MTGSARSQAPWIRDRGHLGEASGVAVVELTIVLPLLLLILLGALELARLFRIVQFSTVLLREAASSAYRGCSEFEEPEGPEATRRRTEECLRDILGGAGGTEGRGLQDLAERLKSGGNVTLILSVYRARGGSDVERLGVAGEQPARSHGTRFREAGGAVAGPVSVDRVFVQRRGRVVVAEVYYPFIPFLGGGPTITGILGPFDYYDAAVL